MHLVRLMGIAAFALGVAAQPEQQAFQVKQHPTAAGPQITSYLQYQAAQAWEMDEQRTAEFAAIRTQADLERVQNRVRQQLLEALGGLPQAKTPLNERVVGKVQRPGYRIEKVIFESLPGIFVTANLYIPDSPATPKPGVLVPCGHSTNGKIYYQYICSRLARLGYVSLTWDPVGQGERSQFWDAAKQKSRYNLICGEHAVLGNLAYLAGTNLARWEIWDGMRALDYLLTRPEVDPDRISITGTSGGGFQAAHIGALDQRIKVVVPSCYITALPMRMYNRIFKDPDSDPEQDLDGMVSRGVDHAGLLLLVYPRPLFLAAAVEDFFPIEGTRRTFREIEGMYRRLGRPERVGMTEGYHGHAYSPENLTAAFTFMNRFNALPAFDVLPAEEKLDDRELLCTRSGQVLQDIAGARPLTDDIRDYFTAHRDSTRLNLAQMYLGKGYPGISGWQVSKYDGTLPERRVAWEARGTSSEDGITIDRYLLHHSGRMAIPALHFHHAAGRKPTVMLWFHLDGKVRAADWDPVRNIVAGGTEVLAFDFRGVGEDRMPYQAASPDDPALRGGAFDESYVSPLSGVLANYIYNTVLTGRPYFLQLIEDAEIVALFAREHLKAGRLIASVYSEDARMLAGAIAETLPGIDLRGAVGRLSWSEIVLQEREVWPIQYLLPGGAYIR